jgi:ribonuclease HII
MLPLFTSENKNICGCDEAGRGSLSGPVVAAAVILPPDFYHPLLNDSKKINKAQRNLLRDYIENNAISWSVSFITNEIIDEINILNASILAMHKAAEQLKSTIDILIIDGNRFKPFKQIPHQCIIKGDSKYAQIAAASILAKTHRDEFMSKLHAEFPQYNWLKNMGYPTKDHRQAILNNGITKHHRKSFRLLADTLAD